MRALVGFYRVSKLHHVPRRVLCNTAAVRSRVSYVVISCCLVHLPASARVRQSPGHTLLAQVTLCLLKTHHLRHLRASSLCILSGRMHGKDSIKCSPRLIEDLVLHLLVECSSRRLGLHYLLFPAQLSTGWRINPTPTGEVEKSPCGNKLCSLSKRSFLGRHARRPLDISQIIRIAHPQVVQTA